jgi:hypothetical protein
VEVGHVRPVLLGYQRVRIGMPRTEVARRLRLLVDFAEREGYALAEVFVDDSADRPLCAFHALINQARRDHEVSAVAVATGDDLSPNPFARRELWVRPERETRVPVHVIER